MKQKTHDFLAVGSCQSLLSSTSAHDVAYYNDPQHDNL